MTIEQRIEYGNHVNNGLKVYVSGKISGLDIETAKAKFESAEQLINSIGMIGVNPLVGADQTKTWEQHMVRDIEMLMGCDAILMLKDWNESRGARIEKTIAEERGMIILNESIISNDNIQIQCIKSAIKEVIGLRFEQYTRRGRKIDGYFARIIFAHHCLRIEGVSLTDVSAMLNRDRTSVRKYSTNYEIELKNKYFRNLAASVENFLKNNVSQ